MQTMNNKKNIFVSAFFF